MIERPYKMHLFKIMTVVLIPVVAAFAIDLSIVTSFDHAYSDKWTHSSAGFQPKLAGSDTTYPGLPLSMYTFFSGYTRNAFGIADVVFSYQVLGRDGKKLDEKTGITAVTGIVEPESGTLPGRTVPQVLLTKKDTPGVYTLRVTAEDRIAGEKKTVEKKVVLANFPQVPPDRFDVISFNVWVHDYCINPDPAGVVAAFSWFVNSASSNDDRIFWPVFYFFQVLFHGNDALVGELVKSFAAGTPRAREYTVFLLRAIGSERSTARQVPDSLWKKFDKVADEGFIEPVPLAIKSKTVQFAETGFYCNGRYDQILFLIECLGLGTPAADHAFVKKYCGGSAEVAPDRETLLRFRDDARMVLAKAYPKHTLLRMFCDFAYANESLNPDAKRIFDELSQSSRK